MHINGNAAAVQRDEARASAKTTRTTKGDTWLVLIPVRG